MVSLSDCYLHWCQVFVINGIMEFFKFCFSNCCSSPPEIRLCSNISYRTWRDYSCCRSRVCKLR